jgi:hypothetical protein
MNHRERPWPTPDFSKARFDRQQEIFPQPFPLLLIPLKRLGQLGLGFRADDERPAHFFRPIRALT